MAIVAAILFGCLVGFKACEPAPVEEAVGFVDSSTIHPTVKLADGRTIHPVSVPTYPRYCGVRCTRNVWGSWTVTEVISD